MNRLFFPFLTLAVAALALVVVLHRESTTQTRTTDTIPGHDPADYGATAVAPISGARLPVPTLPGHDPQDYRAASDTPSDQALVERGAYLVNRASLCIDCHTPHGAQGQPLMDQHLHGSPLPFAPTVPMPAWADVAPRLAGLMIFNDAHVRSVLTTGKRPDGSMPRPPMPPYRLSTADAEAVIAYIRTLR